MSSRNDQTIKLKGGRILGYAEYGDSKGKPVFFLHGWPSSRMHAENMAEAAKKLKVRLIAPDRPGMGLSTYKSDRTLLDYPDDIEELADQLKIKKFAVVGVSGGGPYAAVCAYKIPERITKAGIVVGLGPTYVQGLLKGLALGSWLGWRFYSYSGIIRYLSAWLTIFPLKYFPNLVTKGFPAKEDQKIITPEIKRSMLEKREEAYRQGIQGQALDLKLYTHDWGFDLRNIKTKVYLWYGEADKNVTLAMANYYKKQIPGSELTIYPNEGHLCQITHAEEILRKLVS